MDSTKTEPFAALDVILEDGERYYLKVGDRRYRVRPEDGVKLTRLFGCEIPASKE